MIELITSYPLYKLPYINENALEDYAQQLVLDFSPKLLFAPKPFDCLRFAQQYLGLDVTYKRLAYDQKILGVTAFNTGYIQIINEKTGLPEALEVAAGTVVIDPSLKLKRNWPRFRFTLTHEGCHWITNQRAFLPDNPVAVSGINDNRYSVIKEERAGYNIGKDGTGMNQIERQADFLTSAIVMPKKTLRMAYCDFFKDKGEKPWRRIVRGRSVGDNVYARLLPEYIAKRFEVSKLAALIRLEKLNAITDQPIIKPRELAGGA